MVIAAKTISVLFNPLIVSTVTFFLLIFNNNINNFNYILFLITIFFTTILPFTSIVYFKKIGKLSSFEAPIRKQRLQLLAIASIYNSLGFILLNYLEVKPIIQGLMFCYAVNTAITWQITKYWKISIHMIGLGGPFVALFLIGNQYLITMIIITVLVYVSRLILKAHNHLQLIAGVFLAMLLAYIELTYLFL